MVIVWTENALASLEVIASYVESFFGKQKARQVVREIHRAVQPAKRMPHMGVPAATRANGTHIRRILHKQSLIYYHIVGDTILVDVVWDWRRNPEELEVLLQKI